MHQLIYETVEKLIRQRREALSEHNFPLVSEIENDLKNINIKLADIKDGVFWKLC